MRVRLIIGIFTLVLISLILAVAIRYRYVVLSRLNIGTGGRASVNELALNEITDIHLAGGATRFDYQSIDPERRLLFISHLGSGQVVVFDLKQEKVVSYIQNIASVHGVLAVPSQGRVYASATGTQQVAVIDIQTLQVVADVDGGQYPDGLAYDPDHKKLFVSDESGGADIVIDTQTNKRINRIDLGGEVGNTQYDATGHQIVVAAQGRNQLALIDPQNDTVTSYIDLPECKGPHGFTLDTSNHTAYVSCEANAKLVVVDLNTKQVIGSDSVDARCQTRIAAAARHLGVIQVDLAVALSKSVSHKNIFFDRKMPEVKFAE